MVVARGVLRIIAAQRLHGDETPVRVLAKDNTSTGRLWVYVRDDRPFGQSASAALLHYSPDRRGEHPEQHLAGYAGILQTDAYGCQRCAGVRNGRLCSIAAVGSNLVRPELSLPIMVARLPNASAAIRMPVAMIYLLRRKLVLIGNIIQLDVFCQNRQKLD